MTQWKMSTDAMADCRPIFLGVLTHCLMKFSWELVVAPKLSPMDSTSRHINCFIDLLHLCAQEQSLPKSWHLWIPSLDSVSFSINKIILWFLLSKWKRGAFLVAQWLRIRLPMQGTQVRSLVREDPTCHGATKPVHHNYWACTLELTSHSYWARVPQLLKPVRLEPVHCNEE